MLQTGFFKLDEVSSNDSLARLTGCGACGLYKNCENPKMQATGRGEKGILIIAEAVSAEEDKQGRQLVGAAGTLLRKKLAEHGIDLERDCRKINAVCCRTPKGRAPNANEIAQCHPRVLEELKSFKPKVILLLGGAAVSSFLLGRWKKDLGGITKWRGWTIPDRDFKAWVCPMFHPSYVLRSSDENAKGQYQPVVEVIFNKDLKQAVGCLDRPSPKDPDERSLVEIIEDPRDLCHKLGNTIELESLIAFDYETTGLKPHSPKQRIVSCSISLSGNHAWSFLMPAKGSKAFRLFQELMTCERIGKMAHNAKFEDNWTNVKVGVPVVNWEWDSMIAAHVLDNRSEVTGLKFQAYVHFGILPYDEHISPFLDSDKSEGGNTLNRIDEIPKHELLLYGGLDSMLQFRLAALQKGMLK